MILPFSCFNWLKYLRYDSQKQLIKVKQNDNYQRKLYHINHPRTIT